MEVKFVGNNLVEFNDCRICFRNFSGPASQYNRNADRNFAIVIDSEEAKNLLVERGFNVKIKPPRDEDDTPFMFLPVKVKFNNRGPNIYVQSAGNVKRLTEETVGMLDEIDIQSVDMDLRPYDWEVNGKEGRSAYLQAMNVIQNIDRFGAQYAAQDLPF